MFAWLIAMALWGADEDSIATDERVVFFPTAAYFDAAAGQWRGEVHGWIYEPDLKSQVRLAAFQKALKVAVFDPAQLATFRQRALPFVVDNEGDERHYIRLAGEKYPLEASQSNGHFTGRVKLGPGEAARLPNQGGAAGTWAEFIAADSHADHLQFQGHMLLLPAVGLSVVSDIDDTIKVSEVLNKKRLLERTFLEPFEATPGMVAAYRKLAAAGAAFHYVSASPWQLYPALETFRAEAGYPRGTWHMRRFAWDVEGVEAMLADPVGFKLGQIEPLVKRYPQRQFVLIGDSGERDPEVYGEVARKYSGLVKAIYIRDVTGELATAERYRQAFRDLPADCWRLFTDGAEIDLPGK